MPVATSKQMMQYPATSRNDTSDDYHGTRVADPYRWLEDLGAPATKAWIDAQNEVTSSFLAPLPQRAALETRLTELWNHPRTDLPLCESGHIYYRHNSGLQKQAPLYRRTSMAAPPELLLDPNLLSPDGSLSLAAWRPSPDERYLAYALSSGGADWAEVHVRDLGTGTDLPDVVRWFRFSGIAWTGDGKGFFYARFPEPPAGKALEAELINHQLHYHRVGTAQAEDRLIYWRRELPRYFVGGHVTEDGQYLIVTLCNGTDPTNRLFYLDLGDPLRPDLDAPVVAVADEDIAELTVLGNEGPLFFVRTDLDAPDRRIIAIDVRRGDGPASWESVVRESEHPLESATIAGGKLFCHYLVDVKSEVRVFSLAGEGEDALALPSVTTLLGMSGRERGNDLYYMATAPLFPPALFRYDVVAQVSTVFAACAPAFDPSLYETRQVFFPSKDGTTIPMFITARKGLVLDGSHPALLYAYGGFAISQLPLYRADLPAWLEMGGIYAQPSLRGGAEYGEAWHRAGMFEKKQNVFDDFIAAAEYLVTEKYTTSSRLVIEGRSNGGLLVGAVMTQRPELFSVALPEVGVLDMLRYDRFTGGAGWAAEFGSAQQRSQFEYLVRYSPLHNVRPGTCYPATLVVTANHDDRVVPSHSYKFAAALQAAQGCGEPILIRVETRGSHAYRPTDRMIAERADILAFVGARLDLTLPGT
jgi:prolyl oligopeptidase